MLSTDQSDEEVNTFLTWSLTMPSSDMTRPVFPDDLFQLFEL